MAVIIALVALAGFVLGATHHWLTLLFASIVTLLGSLILLPLGGAGLFGTVGWTFVLLTAIEMSYLAGAFVIYRGLRRTRTTERTAEPLAKTRTPSPLPVRTGWDPRRANGQRRGTG